MRVLVVHNRYQQRGGEDIVVEREVALLRRHGHHVELWTEDNARVEAMSRARLAAGTIWSRAAHGELGRRVAAGDIEVVHFHNTLPLISPSGYYGARSAGAAVVQTLHNYRLVCPPGTLLRAGRPCEDCVGRSPWPAVRHRCYRDSAAASAVVAAMLVAHRAAGTWARAVDAYVALTEFVRDRVLAAGMPRDRVVVKPNFVEAAPRQAVPERGAHVLFVGRLSPEKGVATLIEAWRILGTGAPRLVIVGDGPEAAELAARSAGIAGVELLGAQPRERVIELMADAAALVVPSTGYEGFPLVLVEAFAAGLPVVVSGIGSLATIVRDGVDGLHAPAGDAVALAAVVRGLMADPELRRRLGHGAYAAWKARFTPEHNHDQLLQVYAAARARRHGQHGR
ncbi:MAG TPA: glycosyltransferase family 4 protein [Kofleriaceae bacterium]|jgi:glycosyltransferase involved in cell wall biosynthesis